MTRQRRFALEPAFVFALDFATTAAGTATTAGCGASGPRRVWFFNVGPPSQKCTEELTYGWDCSTFLLLTHPLAFVVGNHNDECTHDFSVSSLRCCCFPSSPLPLPRA